MPDGTEAPWMVLEWVRGVTLADDLDARRGSVPRSPAEVFTLLRPVLAALAKAHAMGIAHRDIKPHNLMLVEPDEEADADREEPRMKLLDFGISKVLLRGEERPPSGETVTHSAAVACTLEYAAPEQVMATRTGPWTDVHQLALVITEMLTHRAPYPGDGGMAIRLKVMSPTRPTPAHFGVDVGAWEPVLAKALALKPSDRYATAKELLAALVEHLPRASSRPPELETSVSPSEAPAAEPAARPGRWRWAAVAVLVASVAAVVIGALSRMGSAQ